VLAGVVMRIELDRVDAPPTRRILELFDEGAIGGLVPVALATVSLTAAMAGVSLAVARRRS
jgi:hypothetical protein